MQGKGQLILIVIDGEGIRVFVIFKYATTGEAYASAGTEFFRAEFFFPLGLAIDGEASKGNGFEARCGNALARHFTNAVDAFFDAMEGFFDFIKRVLFFGEHRKREVAVVGIGTGIALVHTAAGSFAAFWRTANGFTSGACHGIDDFITKVEETLFLFFNEC